MPLSVIAPMAVILSCRSHDFKIGVSPRGAYVRRTVGLSRYPDSSRKTSVAPLARAFFYTLDFFLFPTFDFIFIAFPRPTFGLLAAPMQELAQYFPNVAIDSRWLSLIVYVVRHF